MVVRETHTDPECENTAALWRAKGTEVPKSVQSQQPTMSSACVPPGSFKSQDQHQRRTLNRHWAEVWEQWLCTGGRAGLPPQLPALKQARALWSPALAPASPQALKLPWSVRQPCPCDSERHVSTCPGSRASPVILHRAGGCWKEFRGSGGDLQSPDLKWRPFPSAAAVGLIQGRDGPKSRAEVSGKRRNSASRRLQTPARPRSQAAGLPHGFQTCQPPAAGANSLQ